MKTKHVRLKRYNPRHGIVLRQYWYKGIKFLESEGWYVIGDEVADYLKTHARQRNNDPHSAPAFDICSEEEARELDEQEAIDAEPRRPADNARVVATQEEPSPKATQKRRRKSKAQAEEAMSPNDEQGEKEQK